MTAITAITAQNTAAVTAVYPLPPAAIVEQVLHDVAEQGRHVSVHGQRVHTSGGLNEEDVGVFLGAEPAVIEGVRCVEWHRDGERGRQLHLHAERELLRTGFVHVSGE